MKYLLFFILHLQLITWPDQFHLLSVSSGISAATTRAHIRVPSFLDHYYPPPLHQPFGCHCAQYINLLLSLTYSQLSGFLPPKPISFNIGCLLQMQISGQCNHTSLGWRSKILHFKQTAQITLIHNKVWIGHIF